VGPILLSSGQLLSDTTIDGLSKDPNASLRGGVGDALRSFSKHETGEPHTQTYS